MEDDIEMSTLIDRVIKNIDPKINLDWSTNAEEAIIKLKNASKKGIELPYNLIIADVFLDGSKTGIDLWRYSKKEYGKIPFILTSADQKESLFLKKNLLNFDPIFLQKPFSIQECKTLLKKILGYEDLMKPIKILSP